MDFVDEADMQSAIAERQLIGAVAYHSVDLATVLSGLSGEDFYDGPRGEVWDVCRKLSAANEPIAPVKVARALADEEGKLPPGIRRVIAEMSDAASVLTAERAARLVADLAARRRLVRAVKRAAVTVRDHEGDPSEILAAARAHLDSLDVQDDDSRSGTMTWVELMDEFNAAHAPGASQPGIDTPWDQLNDILGGLVGGRMYVVGGSPGDGKSTVALNIAQRAVLDGHETLVFSKEMSTLDVTGRLVARGAEVDLKSINTRTMNDFDRARVRDWQRKTGNVPLRVNADPVTMGGIQRIARAHHHRRGLKLLVVDYLQLMTGDQRGRSAEEEIAKISTDLKRLAMELDVAVVVPAQLNRNHTARADLKPTKSDLRGSGRIEQDADVVILLWRQIVDVDGPLKGLPDPDFLTFIIDKNRHGDRGMIHLRWNGAYGRVG